LREAKKKTPNNGTSHAMMIFVLHKKFLITLLREEEKNQTMDSLQQQLKIKPQKTKRVIKRERRDPTPKPHHPPPLPPPQNTKKNTRE